MNFAITVGIELPPNGRNENKKRRSFLKQSGYVAARASILPSFGFIAADQQKYGIQLYTFRDEMAKDALGTLKKITAIDIKEIDSARSNKGHYYGVV